MTSSECRAERSRAYGAQVRPLLLTGLAGSLAVSLALAGCADAGGTDSSNAPTTADATTTTIARPDAYAVGRRSIELVDPTRPTDADPNRDLPAEPDRTLPVLLLYPAVGEVPATTEPVDDAVVADGTFPLVVFSHGWTASGPAYERRIQEWARAGYIVAAPTFPLSSGGGGVLRDYRNQPADVSFVIDELLALPDDDPLAGHVDGDAIAAAGHSLGAITTIGVGLNSCCDDERLDAAVELSGTRLPFPDGDFDDLTQVPFLAVHGAKDGVVPVSGSDTLFADAPGPAAYLRLAEGDHAAYLFADGAFIDSVVLAFLDLLLRDDSEAFEDVPELVEEHGGATFEVKPAP